MIPALRTLPAEPLAAWMRSRAAQVGGMSALASQIGEHERALSMIVNGGQRTISVPRVDRIAIAAGTHPNEIYGAAWWDLPDGAAA